MAAVCKRQEAINEFLAYGSKCRNTELFTDVCVTAKKQSFRAHRLILSFYSRRFKAIFAEESEEDGDNTFSEVEINDERVDAASLESLIDFIYSGKININQQNVASLLATSDYLQLDDAKQYCFEYLESNISVETCGEVLRIADMYQNVALLSKSLKYISKIFKISDIRTKPLPDEFKQISKRYLLEFVAKLNEEHIEQRFIYDVIIGWVKYNAKRKEVFAELFQCIKLKKLTLSCLEDTVSNELLVKENRFCLNLVMEAIRLRQHDSDNAKTILSIGGQATRNEVFTVYRDDRNVIGGQATRNEVFTVYTPDRNVYPTLPQAADSHCSLKLDDFVYCIGGWKVISSTDKVWRMKLNEQNLKWQRVPSMMISRSVLSAAVYQNQIAVVGGWTRRARKSAEIYESTMNQWKALKPMNKYRSYHALVSCNDCLFCLGGYDGDTSLSCVEKLCNVDGVWQHVQPMQTPRCEFASVNCLGDIYAIGGRSDQSASTKSVEKYDFQSNSWSYVNEMNFERRGHAACVMQDKIYVVGGKNAANEFVFEIESYDPSSGRSVKWEIDGRTEKKLFRHSIVAI